MKNSIFLIRGNSNSSHLKRQRVLEFAMLIIVALIGISGCKKADPKLSGNGMDNAASSGRLATNAEGDYFSIAVLPDTQYYIHQTHGGTKPMFTSQINWIKNNRTAQKINYVIQLGDITDLGDSVHTEWTDAANIVYPLETPITGFPKGIPYGLAVGNHDQFSPGHVYGRPFSCSTNGYNEYFGISHFTPYSYGSGGYYGGHYASNNDCHYDLFDVDGKGYIAIYIEFDNYFEDTGGLMNSWASGVLSTYADRKAIIVSHSLITQGGPNEGYNDTFAGFSGQGQRIYDAVKTHSNVFMMLCGHVYGNGGEGYREDVYNGHTIRTYLADYQGRTNGGGGLMRLMRLYPDNDYVTVKTFTPFPSGTPAYETDGDSEFERPLFYNETHSRKLDFNWNGKSELALFNAGTWKVSGLSNVSLGTGTGDIPAPADYDGNGRTQYTIYRPPTQEWYKRKEDGSGNYPPVVFGASTDTPVPADYDGNGKADMAVYSPSSGNWMVDYYNNGAFTVTNQVYGGTTGDIPIPADYDGDGKANYAIFRPGTHEWLLYSYTRLTFGNTGDVPVPGDYDGDGKTDPAIFRAPNTWIMAYSVVPGTPYGTYTTQTYTFGATGAIPAPGDYNGDGKTDIAYYLNGTLYVMGGTNITISGTTAADKLLNLPYPIRKVYYP